MIVAEYKFDNTVADLIPAFNEGFTYSYEDVVENNITTRTINSNELPTEMVFGGKNWDNSDPDRTNSLIEILQLDTSNLTTMLCMFYDCRNVTKINTSNWDTSKVTNMRGMFNGCELLTILDLSSWNTSNVTDMSHMFNSCKSLTTLDLSSWNTSKVTSVLRMFSNCILLTTINGNLSNFDTSNMIDMSYMLYNCYSLTSLDVSNWNTSNATDMCWMFYGLNKVPELKVDKFDTSKVTNMEGMFRNCILLTELNVKDWDTSNVTDMSSMFYNCKILPSLNLNKWDTSNVTDMNQMFYNCRTATSLDISNFNTKNVTDTGEMFNKCSKLSHIGMLYSDKESVEKIQSALPNETDLQRTIWVLDTKAKDYTSNEYVVVKNYNLEKHKIRIPQPLRAIGNIKDRMYWDNEKGKYCIEQWIDNIPEGYNQVLDDTLILSEPIIIETGITEKIAFNTHAPYMRITTDEKQLEPTNMVVNFPYKENFDEDITVNMLLNSGYHGAGNTNFVVDIDFNRGDYIEVSVDMSSMADSERSFLQFLCVDTFSYIITYANKNAYVEMLAAEAIADGYINSDVVNIGDTTIKAKISKDGIFINNNKVAFTSSKDIFEGTLEKLKSTTSFEVSPFAGLTYNYIRVIKQNSDGDDIGHLGKYNHYYQTYTNYPIDIKSENLCYIHDSYLTEVYGNTVQDETDLSDIRSVGKLQNDNYRIKFNISSSSVKFGGDK